MDEKFFNGNEFKNWYAMYTKPRSEFKAAQQLNVNKIIYYLPTVTIVRQWSDRKKKDY